MRQAVKRALVNKIFVFILDADGVYNDLTYTTQLVTRFVGSTVFHARIGSHNDDANRTVFEDTDRDYESLLLEFVCLSFLL